jgi:periplasmic protein TonB
MAFPIISEHLMPEAYQGASPNSRFLAGAVPASETSWQSYGQRFAGSVLTHIVGLLIVLFVATRLPAVSPSDVVTTPPPDITWIASPGPGGGGGGGGNKMPDPPRKAEIVAPKPRSFTPPPPKPEVTPPKPQPQMNIPAVTSVQELPGAVSQLPDATIAQGPSVGGGGGTGTGSGVGSGTGSGYGAGTGGGFGGGAYREGNGVTSPRVIKEVKPSYTGEAMRARIHGLVTMEAIVMPDGSVGNVQIIKSLDNNFGLDKEAIKTVKQWRFEPGRRLGQPVPVLIVIEMTFTLR